METNQSPKQIDFNFLGGKTMMFKRVIFFSIIVYDQNLQWDMGFFLHKSVQKL